MRSFEIPFAVPTLLSVLLLAAPAVAQPAQAPDQDDVEIEIEAEDSPPPSPVAPPPVAAAPNDAERQALVATVARLEARLAELEARSSDRGDRSPSDSASEEQDPSRSTTRASGVTDTASSEADETRPWWERANLRVSGYLQAQLEGSQLSQDELAPGGASLNFDRFVLRRGRIRVDARYRYASAAIEIDGSTTRGAFLSLRRAEASFFYPAADENAVPLVMATVGLSEIPFGGELREVNRLRYFMERSAASLAFFRGEPDVGARVSGGVGPFRYVFGVMNGLPLDDRPGAPSVDFTRAKDIVGRLGVDLGDVETWNLVGGVSFLRGTGFSAGAEATKGELRWTDFNENGVVDNGEVEAISGVAAVPSESFRRWAVNADVSLTVSTPIGRTRVYGELTMASNLDRGYAIADPIATGYNLREFGYFAAVIQDIKRYGIVGFRYDSYDPDSDYFEVRRGQATATDLSIRTYSPIIGAQLPGRARLLFQYDFIRDRLARDSRGIPVDVRNNQFVLRLQVEL